MILLAGPWGFFVAVHVFNLAGPIGLDRAGMRVFWSILLLPIDDELFDEGLGVRLRMASCCEAVLRFFALFPSLVYAPSKAPDATGIGCDKDGIGRRFGHFSIMRPQPSRFQSGTKTIQTGSLF